MRLSWEAGPECAGETSQTQESGYNPEHSADSSEMFKQESDAIRFAFETNYSSCSVEERLEERDWGQRNW